jgi:hypothetical protein
MAGEPRRADAAATLLMASGGDARITLDPATGLNRYWSAPRPSTVTAYASSTANDLSDAAFAHVAALNISETMNGCAYSAALERLRVRLRAAYLLGPDTDIVFAPSGTDLEYVALTMAQARGERGVHNILLGADEVGSGCVHAASGRFFAEETAIRTGVRTGDPIAGLADGVTIADLPVRDANGAAHDSATMATAIDAAVIEANAAGRHPLIHIVHGSKTGLVLPELAEIDWLIARHGAAMSLVVDACQARICPASIAAYLERDAIVFLTGSKFMGGPPFSGFALIPAGARPMLAPGFSSLSRRAEWPAGWAGANRLGDDANPGLLLRLESAVFELERFSTLGAGQIGRVIAAFSAAVDGLATRIGARRIMPPPGNVPHPVESGTLATLDLSWACGSADFDEARRRHAALVKDGVRLGQPVKCVRLPDGRWGATMRIALSMPQIVAMDVLDDRALDTRLRDDMDRIAKRLMRLQERVPA